MELIKQSEFNKLTNNEISHLRAKPFCSFDKILLLDENLRENFLRRTVRDDALSQHRLFSKRRLDSDSPLILINRYDEFLDVNVIETIDASDIKSVVMAEIMQDNKEKIRFREEWGL